MSADGTNGTTPAATHAGTPTTSDLRPGGRCGDGTAIDRAECGAPCRPSRPVGILRPVEIASASLNLASPGHS
jgi:hypothetical protein